MLLPVHRCEFCFTVPKEYTVIPDPNPCYYTPSPDKIICKLCYLNFNK